MALLHRSSASAALLHSLHQRASSSAPLQSRPEPSIRSSMPIRGPSRGLPGRAGRSAGQSAAAAPSSLWDAVQGSSSGEGEGQQPWGLAVAGEAPLGYSNGEAEGIVPLTDDAEAFGPECAVLCCGAPFHVHLLQPSPVIAGVAAARLDT
ncbi:unnamed protein product [Closterium sp. NIES-53]